MYSAYKLNKQGNSIQPCHSPSWFWTSHLFMLGSNCCFLTHLHVSQEAGQEVWYSHLFKNFPRFVVIHAVEGFCVVSKAEVGVFLEFLAFSLIQWMLAVWPLVSLPFLNPAVYIWKFSVHILLKPSLKDFEHNITSMRNEHNSLVVWTFFGAAFLWVGMENDPFQCCGHWCVFHICWHIDCSSLTESSFVIWNSSAGILSPPLALSVVMFPKAHFTL